MKKILIGLFVLAGFSATAQNLPERGEIRQGNSLFEDGEYEMAIENYTKALTFSPNSFDANYNLSNAQHKAQQFEKAEESMAKLAADSLRNSSDRADAYYNLGNSQFHQQKYKEALESYKSSVRLNPSDSTAKYNYALTKLLMEAQPESEDQDQQDQDQQDQDQDQDQQDQDQDQQDQDQDQQDQDQQDQEQNQDQNQDQQDQQPQDQQPQESRMSEQELNQILDAIQAQEDKTQEKLDEEKGRAILIPGGNNW